MCKIFYNQHLASYTKRGNRGFSLVELLVVMAILTVLAAIVLPTVLQVRNRALGSQCLSHLRQLGAAVSMYASDFDGRLPLATGSPFGHGMDNSSVYASAALEQYVRSSGVFACPNDRGTSAFGFPESVSERLGTSYLWNIAKMRNGWLVNGRLLGTVDVSSPLFQDYGPDWHGTRLREGINVLERSQVNTLYADGHAASSVSYSFSTHRGSYAAGVSAQEPPGKLWIAGTTEYGSAYVHGSFGERSALGLASMEYAVEVYGTIYSDSGVYDVNHVFSYGIDASVETVLQRIITWIETLIVQ